MVTWRRQQRYSPVQDRAGIRRPDDIDFPPATERVTQAPDPFGHAWADEREILRATYQGDDVCQLACPGCYTRDLLQISPATAAREGRRKSAPFAEFTAHVDALGPGMQDLYVLGAEPTMDPAGTAAKLEHARTHGWPQQVITHGAVSVDRFEETFGAALDSGQVYMLIISLDSMDPAVHNRLRGRPYAHERTLRIIRHCIARGAPLKVQMTVWPLNYPTIIGSVEALFDLGVRAFSFHCGTLEGVTDAEADAAGLAPVDPLAWRALADRLLAFRDAHLDELWHFNVPFLYFTEEELREQVIGDAGQTAAYLEHVDAAEAGRPSVKPVHACPALDVPQVYVWANRGPQGRGTLSLCNIDRDPVADAYADYDPSARRWRVRRDPERNQLQHMANSPHLCPATPYALRTGTDRAVTEIGPLFHACRYIASNQMPAPTRIRAEIYRDAAEFYRAVGRALDSYPYRDGRGESPLARITRVTGGIVALADRTRALNADLSKAAVDGDTPSEDRTGASPQVSRPGSSF
ncbi:radical SAM protein [Actinomadura sp. BRA 177]|uniref:radical SAM protein n=1 Tax=Actinomadura sp. BRA 177 TaxID=2745202 RepID=UPI00159603B1|nr:radical SAM protein [Actinomadura sp. BRA 177]NVI92393.1 radical SAM protein [Actinomadura sp. BRA 177]